MTPEQLRSLARLGAMTRLQQMAVEQDIIAEEFPELLKRRKMIAEAAIDAKPAAAKAAKPRKWSKAQREKFMATQAAKQRGAK